MSGFKTWGWVLVSLLGTLSVGAAIAAAVVGGQARTLDPCATPGTNPWVGVSLGLVLFAVASSVLHTYANKGDYFEVQSGVVRSIVMFIALPVMWFVVAVGGYGWHCLE